MTATLSHPEITKDTEPESSGRLDFTLTESYLPQGEIGERAVELYTQGLCWYLAWVLHERTGWPIVVVADSHPRYINWCHMLVERPDGLLVDIHGAQSRKRVLRHWRGECDDPPSAHLKHMGQERWEVEEFDQVLGADPRSVLPAHAQLTERVADVVLAEMEHLIT